MSLSVFPSLPGLTYTSVKAPGFKTDIQSGSNESEVRLPQYSNPVWKWTLIFDFLHDFFWGSFTAVSELRTLMGFFNSNLGSAAAFLYTDPDDNSVGPAVVGGEPNVPLAQLALVSDGVGNYYSPVQRTLDGVSYEDITDLNGGIAVYLDGTLATAGSGANQYALEGPGLAIPGYSWLGMVLKWGPGAPSWASGTNYLLNAEIIDPAGHIQKATARAWAANTAFVLNAEIVDPSGHIQKAIARAWAANTAFVLNAEIVDPSGHIQKATTAGTSGATAPSWNDSGGTTPDGAGTLVWTDQGTASGLAGVSGGSIPSFNDTGGNTPDGAGTLVWTDQGTASGHAGVSGGSIPSFNDTGGSTPDGTGTLIWMDEGYYPGPPAPVTAQFRFYFRVRFDTDSQDFEKFLGVGSAAGQPPVGQGGGYWTIGGSESQNGTGTLVLRTARPVPL